MAVTLSVNGVDYSYPQLGDSGWATAATGWAQAITSGTLQKAGGNFALTADVDFGASFGLKSLYFKSRSSNVSSVGVVRLANTEAIAWRNAANSANLSLSLDASNIFQLGGPLTANSFAVTSATVPANGFYLSAANTIGFAANTAAVASLTTSIFSLVGASASAFNIQRSVDDGSLVLSGGTSSANSVVIYGGSNGVAPNTIAFNTQSAQVGSIDGNGKWILGASGGTQVHAFNGGISATLNMTAAAHIPSGSTVPTNGMYLSAANTVSFATNTTARMSLDSTGVIGLGASASDFLFKRGVTDGTISLSGGTSLTGGGNVRIYGSGHATKASYTEIYAGSGLLAQFTGSGAINLGQVSAMGIAIGAAGGVTIGNGTALQHAINTLLATNGAVSVSMTNAPTGVAATPKEYMQITINGNTRYIPLLGV